ncbi:MAG: alpha-L-fucosidase [Saprospiraceae bacterium]
MPNIRLYFIWFFTFLLVNLQQVNGQNDALPHPRQLSWQDLEYYAFIHFSINTFTDKEWGYGDESPALFHPSELDTDQWARVAKAAGMKGIVLTAKHHDGFCLWPSAYTDHSVKNSPWKNGQGDLVKDLAASCQKYGLLMGVYLSPWDRNHPDYGTPAYLTYYRNQLRELLTNYGPIFEVWFDGANGGDGYYGGANEVRTVDKKSYYDWPTTHQIIRELQPNAVIFSDAGPDIRWVGNEKGYANQTTWSTIYRDSVYGGMLDFARFAPGQEEGTHWIPTETDVSIRKGWFYHAEEDDQVKTPTQLWDIYCNSVGLNSNLLLNLPVDRRGLVHENDVYSLMGLKSMLDQTFQENLMTASTASNLITDGDRDTYISKQDELKFEFKQPVEADLWVVQEAIQMGQHIRSFNLKLANEKGEWQTVYEGTTVGNKRIVRFDKQKITAIAFEILDAKNEVQIAEAGLYLSATSPQ